MTAIGHPWRRWHISFMMKGCRAKMNTTGRIGSPAVLLFILMRKAPFSGPLSPMSKHWAYVSLRVMKVVTSSVFFTTKGSSVHKTSSSKTPITLKQNLLWKSLKFIELTTTATHKVNNILLNSPRSLAWVIHQAISYFRMVHSSLWFHFLSWSARILLW